MTTLGALKGEIADDLARDDLSTQIASAITSAIFHYQQERFFFNETRTATFATVSGQSRYSSSDDTDIPLFLEMDAFWLDDASSQYELSVGDPEELDFLIGLDDGASGRPHSYARFGDGFILYPEPDAVYTARPMGHIEIAAPASDSEANNPWMTKAYELIRCRAKAYLFLHVIKDANQAMGAGAGEGQALSALRSKTNRKNATGHIRPTLF